MRMMMSFQFLPPPPSVDDFSEESSFYEILPCCARFRCGELIVEGQWHHLVLVMSKGMLKNSTATLYIDGQLVSTVKVSVLRNPPYKTVQWCVQSIYVCVCKRIFLKYWLNFNLSFSAHLKQHVRVMWQANSCHFIRNEGGVTRY